MNIQDSGALGSMGSPRIGSFNLRVSVEDDGFAQNLDLIAKHSANLAGSGFGQLFLYLVSAETDTSRFGDGAFQDEIIVQKDFNLVGWSQRGISPFELRIELIRTFRVFLAAGLCFELGHLLILFVEELSLEIKSLFDALSEDRNKADEQGSEAEEGVCGNPVKNRLNEIHRVFLSLQWVLDRSVPRLAQYAARMHPVGSLGLPLLFALGEVSAIPIGHPVQTRGEVCRWDPEWL